jgi:hypothetical protein
MVLIFIIVREEIIECIRGEGRVDRQKVKHIPNTSYYFQTQSGLSFERFLDRLYHIKVSYVFYYMNYDAKFFSLTCTCTHLHALLFVLITS